MAEYLINKGVDKSIECFGLKSQYCIFVVVGLALLFLTTTILLALNTSVLLVFPLIGVCVAALFYGATWMNKELGESGLTKIHAKRLRHTLFSNRKLITAIVQTNKKWSTQKK